jgi:hypothetical protein
MPVIIVTDEEQKAIASLKRLAKRWPKTVSLFGWSGTLCVVKRLEDGRQGLITTVDIMCDGGDPSDDEVSQDCEIEYA